jgi:hypothetical protein
LTKKYVVAYLSRNRLLNIPGAKSSDGFIAGAMPLLLVFAQIQNGLKEYKVDGVPLLLLPLRNSRLRYEFRKVEFTRRVWQV